MPYPWRNPLRRCSFDIATLARVVGTLSRDLLGLRDRALLLVGFFAALRRAGWWAWKSAMWPWAVARGPSPIDAARPTSTVSASRGPATPGEPPLSGHGAAGLAIGGRHHGRAGVPNHRKSQFVRVADICRERASLFC